MSFKQIVFIFCFVNINNLYSQGNLSGNVIQKIKTDTSYYNTGMVKTISAYSKDNNDYLLLKKSILNNDTIFRSICTNNKDDSTVYRLEYDTLGNLINDNRVIYYTFNKIDYFVNDTVEINYYILGPQVDNIILSASALRVLPDTSISFSKSSNNGKIKYHGSYKFIPNKSGLYNVRMGAFILTPRIIVSDCEIDIEVK